MVHDKKKVGMPVRPVGKEDRRAKNEAEIIEQWPLIQAYGLDVVGNGFFTMKHKFTCLRDQLWELYSNFDSFSLNKIFFNEVGRLNQTYFDNFFNLNKMVVEKRIKLSEIDLVKQFKMEYEFSGLRRKTTTQLENNINELKISLKARVLLGPIRTNATFEVESDKE
jgi:hypothetical protein